MAEAKRIIVTGATGLIGSGLCRELIKRGYAVVVFSRDPAAARTTVPGAEAYVAWQAEENGRWTEYIEGAYGVVNLAGGSIYTWGSRQTRESISAETQNRVRAIQGLVRAMTEAQAKPQVFVSASSVGTYGFEGFTDAEFTESSAPGTDFWGQVSLPWEEAARASEKIGVRAVVMRFGYVLAMHPHSGLAQQVQQFRRGFGGRVGSGKQWQPWIHVADATGLTGEKERMEVLMMPSVVTPNQHQGREAARWEIVRHVEHGMTATQNRPVAPLLRYRNETAPCSFSSGLNLSSCAAQRCWASFASRPTRWS